MVSDRQLIWAGFLGACAMAVLELLSADWRARAAGGEEEACKDGADTRAYMSRLPGEPHTAERCVLMMRYGSPSWVPELSHPLKPSKLKSGKSDAEWQREYLDQLGREQQ